MHRMRGISGAISWSVVSLLIGHQLAYAIVYRDAHVLAHVLKDTGHNWLSLAPILLMAALITGLMLALGRGTQFARSRRFTLALIAIQLVAYVGLEVVERLAHGLTYAEVLASLTAGDGLVLLLVGLGIQVLAARGTTALAREIARLGILLLQGPALPRPSLRSFALSCTALVLVGIPVGSGQPRGPPTSS
jgi:hypothetical protein